MSISSSAQARGAGVAIAVVAWAASTAVVAAAPFALELLSGSDSGRNGLAGSSCNWTPLGKGFDVRGEAVHAPATTPDECCAACDRLQQPSPCKAWVLRQNGTQVLCNLKTVVGAVYDCGASVCLQGAVSPGAMPSPSPSHSPSPKQPPPHPPQCPGGGAPSAPANSQGRMAGGFPWEHEVVNGHGGDGDDDGDRVGAFSHLRFGRGEKVPPARAAALAAGQVQPHVIILLQVNE
jgi:hypothetical protein